MNIIKDTTHDINARRHDHGNRSRKTRGAQPKQGEMTQLNPLVLNREANQTSTMSNIFKFNIGDTASKQESAFKKGCDVMMPPPFDPKNRT